MNVFLVQDTYSDGENDITVWAQKSKAEEYAIKLIEEGMSVKHEMIPGSFSQMHEHIQNNQIEEACDLWAKLHSYTEVIEIIETEILE